MEKTVLRLMVVVGLLMSLCGCWEISEGERYGEIVKFSHKGAFWRTWEGEMILGGGVTNATDQVFAFSIDNSSKRGENIKELSNSILEAQRSGMRVKLTYKQEMIAAPWRADTSYLIQTVELVK